MTNKLNEHGQPIIRGYNHTNNKIKALLALRGILEGVTSDQKLNETELLFLDMWLKTDDDIKDDGDFLDLRDIIEDILEDGVIEPEELEELQAAVQDVLDYGYNDLLGSEAVINQFLGFLQGITSDDSLHDKEIMKLKELLENNEDTISRWPGDIIYRRLIAILEDGVIDEEERADLLSMLKGICGQQFTDTGDAECVSTDFFANDIEIECLLNKTVCFTGKFIAGTRKTLEAAAKSHGAIVKKDVVQTLDYLVIGSMASRDWKFTSHGRKIEATIANQRLGFPSQIIKEEAWSSFIE
ncbi:BRCT domain-containing protein [Vibrio cortegadensis]|uniref:BRCT domain-containing protein n=1 Tax=Vibrio cortegadensis TaxID=1328770 RepID=A0ABV4M3V0_9VIBR